MIRINKILLFNDVSLSCKPFFLLTVGVHPVNIHTHLSYYSILSLVKLGTTFYILFFCSFYTIVFTLVRVINSLLTFSHVIHETVLEEQTSSDRINSFSVHFFNVFDVTSNRNFVSWFQDANPR